METAPRNCRFLSLVVVERVLSVRQTKKSLIGNFEVLGIAEIHYLKIALFGTLLPKKSGCMTYSKVELSQIFLVWPPLQSLAVKKRFIFADFGR